MGKFHETLDQFGNALELPDDLRSALSSAYEDDFSTANAKVDGLVSSITEKDTLVEQMRVERDNAISAAKAANYDLLRAGLSSGATVDNSNNANNDDEQNSSNITINDLFG